MNTQDLLNEREQLKKYLSLVNEKLSSVSFAGINNANYQTYVKGNRIYLYEYHSESQKRTYLPISSTETVKLKYQYEYLKSLKLHIHKQLKSIDNFLKTYNSSAVLDSYDKLSSGRKQLVTPIIPPDEEYLSEWLAQKQKMISLNSNSYKITDAFVTDNGEYVRSKSEKFIADKLKSRGIFYVYECPLITADNRFLFPDFTILDLKTRTEKYLEHCGRMDDPEYTSRFVIKNEMYEKSGLILGKNLFYTFETAELPLKTSSIDSVIDNMMNA